MPRGGARPGAGRKPAPTTDHDIQQFVEALRPVHVGRGGYQRIDRYRDFHQVLVATPEGKRVLSQIIDLLEGPPIREDQLHDHALLAARAWSRRIALTISSYASVPPPPEMPETKRGKA